MPELRRRCAKGKGCRQWQPCPVHGTSGWENNQSRPVSNNQKALKRAVIKRDGARCKNCGTSRSLELDHIVPRSENGTDDLKNLQLLCGADARGCHGAKTRADRIKYGRR